MPTSRTRVLFVRPSLGTGGADRVTVQLLRALPRDRYEVSVALMHLEGPFVADLPDDVNVVDLGGGRLHTAWLPLARHLRQTPYDVVFSTSGGTNPVLVIAAGLARSDARVVLSERSMLFRLEDRSLKRRALTASKRLLYERADLITTVSGGVRDDLVETFGLDSALVRVVYNPVIDESLEADAAAPVEHSWFAEDRDLPVFLAAGRFVSEKGFDVLLSAFRQMLDGGRQARLVLLGEGALRDQLEGLVRELRLGEHVSMPGFDKNPFRYMARADAFVLASRFEGLPGALIQAMACGAPPISTDCPSGPSEILARPKTDGMLIPVEDEVALADAMGEMLDLGPVGRAKMGRHARATAQRFREDRVLQNYEAAILGEPDPVETSHL